MSKVAWTPAPDGDQFFRGFKMIEFTISSFTELDEARAYLVSAFLDRTQEERRVVFIIRPEKKLERNEQNQDGS